jgi:hypothetical protein
MRALVALFGLLPALAGPGGSSAGDWSGGGPEIGWIYTLMEASDGTLYAGTWGGGVFRSFDGGDQWEEATTNAPDAVVLDLLEGNDPARTLYAATADRALLRKEPTTDFWTRLGRYPNGDQPSGESIERFPTRDFRIAFGTDDGVYMSNDRGNSWPDTLVFATGQSATDIVVLPELPNTVHALTPLELIITSDSGNTEQSYADGLSLSTFMLDLEPWSSGTDSLLAADLRGGLWAFVDRERFVDVGPGEPGRRSAKYVSRVDPQDGDRILLGASNGLWRTTDRLASWSRVDDQMPALGAEIWDIEPTRVSAGDELRMGSFTLGFLRTAAGGDAPWKVSNSGLTAAWARTIEPGAAGTLCGTAHGRLFRTADGSAWEDVTGSLRTLQISVSHDTGTSWIVSGSRGVVRTTDDGATWKAVTLPFGVTRLNHMVEAGDRLFAATNFGLVSSVDDGVSFQSVAGIPVGRASFALAAAGDGTIGVGIERASGEDLPTIHVGVPGAGFLEIGPPAEFGGAPRGLGFVGEDLIVGTTGFGGSALYRIVDWASAGRAYVDLSADLGDGLFEVRDMDTRANLVAVGTIADGVFLSTNEGRTWSEYGGSLPTRRIEAVAFSESPARALWVATLGRGAWVRELDPGVAVVVSGLRVEPFDRSVRLSVDLQGAARLRVWREVAGWRETLFEGQADGGLELMDAPQAAARIAWGVDLWTGEDWLEVERVERNLADIAVPRASRLLPAYPNPFNPQTTLRFELASAGRTTLTLFDTRGRRVRGLVDQELSAGPHELNFDGVDDRGTALASGVYYLLLRAPDGERRGRVTLLR